MASALIPQIALIGYSNKNIKSTIQIRLEIKPRMNSDQSKYTNSKL